VNIELAEDLSRIEEMSVVDNPSHGQSVVAKLGVYSTYFLTFQPRRGKLRMRGIQ